MYLRGDFGTDADTINPYAASAFYAVDRIASYELKWKRFFKAGGIVLADRYTTSNMLYQMIKIPGKADQDAYLDWLWDFEFKKLGLPEPDAVILLDVPLEVTERLMSERTGKTGGTTGDIHEKDREFLRKCHAAYVGLAAKYGWYKIDCTRAGVLRSPRAIHEDVYALVKGLI